MEGKKDISDFLDRMGEAVAQSADRTLVFLWRLLKKAARFLHRLFVAFYKIAIAVLAPIFLFSFGTEIALYTNLSLGWKVLGWLMFAIGIAVLCLVALFFIGRLYQVPIKDREKRGSLAWFTLFTALSLFIIRLTAIKISGDFWSGTLTASGTPGYIFKLFILGILQENINSLLIGVAIFIGIIAVLYPFSLFYDD